MERLETKIEDRIDNWLKEPIRRPAGRARLASLNIVKGYGYLLDPRSVWRWDTFNPRLPQSFSAESPPGMG